MEKMDVSKLKVNIKTKSAKMNAYIYETKSRTEMGAPGSAGNLQVNVGDTYTVDPKKGFLVVFWNSDNTDGKFSFEYWVEAGEK